MSEPVTLYKGTQTITVVAPSEARRLFSEGWNYEQGQRQEGQEPQGRQEGQEEGEGQAVEPEPQFDAPQTMTLELVQKPKRKPKG